MAMEGSRVVGWGLVLGLVTWKGGWTTMEESVVGGV
jgi:hypothetical protein